MTFVSLGKRLEVCSLAAVAGLALVGCGSSGGGTTAQVPPEGAAAVEAWLQAGD